MASLGFVSAILVLLVAMPSATKAFVSPSKMRTSSGMASRLFLSTTTPTTTSTTTSPDVIDKEHPLVVVIAGAGVGGLALANVLQHSCRVVLLERTEEFKRFGGPIQLASNALQIIKTMDGHVYDKIMKEFTFTGDKENGIKDGIRDEWYAKFDLATPAKERDMPYTGVIDRPDLQDIYIKSLAPGILQNGDGVVGYTKNPNGGVAVKCSSGKIVQGDVLIGADGIWSNVRSAMRNEPSKGEGSGASYSGYTVFAGELAYASIDNGQVGYKVYIGPQQYFVITDIGKGNYQWYAFLAKPAGSAEMEEKPNGSSLYLQDVFTGWSPDIHHILKATKEHEIQQRDLYDRPPSVIKPWTDESVALLGDSIHAMMPNLGQGGCQAIEDAMVLAQELQSATKRSDVPAKLATYRSRRLVRSAAVQGLSRFASDIIIRGFDTPAKIVFENGVQFQNFNYAGIVTKMLQPILPIFFNVQFNFLYEGWKNEGIDIGASFGFVFIGGFILLLGAGSIGEAGLLGGLGLESLLGGEGLEALFASLREFI